MSDAAGPHRCPRQEDHRARPQDPGTCAHRHGAPPREHPGIGPISAVALEALAPPAETFAKGRDFAVWLGLTPRQNSPGGRARLGKTSKMGQRDLRRLLIIGATTVVQWAVRKGAPAGSWLARMLARKPRMLVAIALANRMARVAWALMTRGGVYRAPVAAT